MPYLCTAKPTDARPMQESRDELIHQLLEQRDQMYREIRLLEDRISSLESRTGGEHLSRMESELAARSRELEQKDRTIREQEDRIARLEGEIAWLRRKMWGRMSEKHIPEDPNQRLIEWEGLELLPEEQEAARAAEREVEEMRQRQEKRRREIAGRRKPVRKPLPEELPHRYTDIFPEGYDEKGWTIVGDPETSEHLHLIPGSFIVEVVRRYTAIRNADKRIETAPVPLQPIPRSYATPSLLAELIIGKYADHLPFYRQIEIFRRMGVSLPAATVNDWFFEVADLMRPLYHRIRELVMSSDYVQCDETTIPIVNEEKHRTVKGYLWDVRAVMSGLLFFHYDHGSRAQKVALGLFHSYRGALQTDGYGVYDSFENRQGILLLGCWVHARRYFERALDNDRARAEYALAQIARLYSIEQEADDSRLTYEQRAELRRRVAYPLIRAFEQWMLDEAPKVMPKSPIGKAIEYTYRIYYRLSRYHLDGRYLLDNNLIENSIRPIAVGRKNYLFCRNDDAAEDAAIIYTMMGCCKAAGADFRKWTSYFLEHIHEYDNDYSKPLDDFLPATLKERGLV